MSNLSLDQHIKALTCFMEYPGISKIILHLKKLNKLKNIQQKHIEEPRKALLLILLQESKVINNAFKSPLIFINSDLEKTNRYNLIFKLVYDLLLTLAELAPLNEKDPVTMDYIDEKNKLYTCEGHLFDINSLVKFNNTRIEYNNDGSVFKLAASRSLINIFTSLPFSIRERRYIEERIKVRQRDLLKENSGKIIIDHRQKQLEERCLLVLLAFFIVSLWQKEDKSLGAVTGLFFIASAYHAWRGYTFRAPEELEEAPLFEYQFGCEEGSSQPPIAMR